MQKPIEITQDKIDKITKELEIVDFKQMHDFIAGVKWALREVNSQEKEAELKNEFELVKEVVLKMGFWQVDDETFRSHVGDISFDSSIKFTDLKNMLHMLGQKHKAHEMRKALGLEL